MLSVVLAVTAASDRSMSAEIALIWVAASAEVAVSELWASLALFRIEAAVSPRHGEVPARVGGLPGGCVQDREAPTVDRGGCLTVPSEPCASLALVRIDEAVS